MDLRLSILIAGFISLALYGSYRAFKISANRRKAAYEYGCKPISSKYPHRDPFFGLDLFLINANAAMNRCFLQTINARFATLGNTYLLNDVGDSAIMTREPEVIKTVLAVRFDDYGLGNDRKNALSPLLGHSIFTNDGSAWEQSRAILRPQFVRSQVRDMALLERHVSHLIDLIPRDGSTTDLQDLLFRMTMDTATEFLFGEPTNCLKQNVDSQYMGDFVEAFHYAQDIIAMRLALGSLVTWMPNPKFHKSVQKAHDFVDQYTA